MKRWAVSKGGDPYEVPLGGWVRFEDAFRLNLDIARKAAYYALQMRDEGKTCCLGHDIEEAAQRAMRDEMPTGKSSQ